MKKSKSISGETRWYDTGGSETDNFRERFRKLKGTVKLRQFHLNDGMRAKAWRAGCSAPSVIAG
jgi:hypothetical protein